MNLSCFYETLQYLLFPIPTCSLLSLISDSMVLISLILQSAYIFFKIHITPCIRSGSITDQVLSDWFWSTGVKILLKLARSTGFLSSGAWNLKCPNLRRSMSLVSCPISLWPFTVLLRLLMGRMSWRHYHFKQIMPVSFLIQVEALQ